ncbi:MAG TPA: cell division protein FtsZ, partial [Devosia sp.]|nr:cell division protein FtsZ [Devosia sp.]
TYDPEMTGTIRVAVVATGTDATMVQALEPMKANASRAPLAVRPRQPASEPVPQAQPAQQQPHQLEADVRQAVAEAITQPEPQAESYAADDGVTVEPYIPNGGLDHYEDTAYTPEPPIPTVYVPSRAERPEGQQRMPRTEELPAVARKPLQVEDRQDSEPRNARALFKRLASNVGLGLRPQQAPEADETHYTAAQDAAARSAIEAGQPRNSGTSAAPTGAAGKLDIHGRQLPPKEHIEIPSFLRKHG